MRSVLILSTFENDFITISNEWGGLFGKASQPKQIPPNP